MANAQRFEKITKYYKTVSGHYEDQMMKIVQKLTQERNELKQKLREAEEKNVELDRENIRLATTNQQNDNFISYLNKQVSEAQLKANQSEHNMIDALTIAQRVVEDSNSERQELTVASSLTATPQASFDADNNTIEAGKEVDKGAELPMDDANNEIVFTEEEAPNDEDHAPIDPDEMNLGYMVDVDSVQRWFVRYREIKQNWFNTWNDLLSFKHFHFHSNHS